MYTPRRLEPLPPELMTIPDAPETLYAVGDCSLLKKRKIAIIGTRRPQAYTKEWTRKLASAVAGGGGVVVSGAAMGVDAVAHQGAGDATIAVMGNSLDIIYPKVNKNLIQTIYDKSLALSEYPEGYEARPYSFVLRNRIVVGLSEAVVITQADMNSGSMTSAKIALEQGKPLYVLPHRLGESEGTNSLLQVGKAQAIHSVEAFIQEIGLDAGDKEEDPVLRYLADHPDYAAAVAKYGETIFAYELEGKITVENNRVRVL